MFGIYLTALAVKMASHDTEEMLVKSETLSKCESAVQGHRITDSSPKLKIILQKNYVMRLKRIKKLSSATSKCFLNML